MRLRNGHTIYVDADHVYGDYAIHHWVTPRLTPDTGFTVTHRPSGISVWTVDTYPEALRIAEYLHGSKVLPSDPLALEHLMQVANSPGASDERKKILAIAAELAKIAPRVLPPSFDSGLGFRS